MSLFGRSLSEPTSSPRLPSPSVLFAGARALARTYLGRRAALRISEMPDYLLSDIGLKRDDVHDALGRDWREDPTFRLAVTAAKRRRTQ